MIIKKKYYFGGEKEKLMDEDENVYIFFTTKGFNFLLNEKQINEYGAIDKKIEYIK